MLGGVDVKELEEGGWHGPVPAAMSPIPEFRRLIERIYADPSRLQQLSTRSHAAAADYVTERRHGLLRTLHSICDASTSRAREVDGQNAAVGVHAAAAGQALPSVD